MYLALRPVRRPGAVLHDGEVHPRLLEDRTFIEARTEGFEAWAASWQSRSRSSTLPKGHRGPGEFIRRASETYARERPSSILWTLGITEHENGSDNVSSLVNLALLTGNVGCPGSGLNPLRGQNNVQGGGGHGRCRAACRGTKSLSDPEVSKKFEARWGRSLPGREGLEEHGDDSPGPKWPDSAPGTSPGEFGALASRLGERGGRLPEVDLLVVQHILYLTETAEYADIVLPAASSFEKTGTFTNIERRVQMVRPLFAPPGQARADWKSTRSSRTGSAIRCATPTPPR